MRTLTTLALAGVLGAAAPAWAEPAPADHAEWFLDAQAVRPSGFAGHGAATPTGAWRLGGQGQFHGAFLLSEFGWVGPHARDEAANPHGPSWEGEAMAGPAVPFGPVMISPGLAFRGLRIGSQEDTHAPHFEHALGLGLHAEAHGPFSTFGEGNVRYYPAITGSEAPVAASGYSPDGVQFELVASRAFNAALIPGLGYRYERWGDVTLQIVFARLSLRPGPGHPAGESHETPHEAPHATTHAGIGERSIY